MKRTLLWFAGMVLVGGGLIGLVGHGAVGKEWIHEEFKSRYVKADSTDANDVAFREAVDHARCAICHVVPGGMNAYGREVAKVIKMRGRKDPAKLDAAFKKLDETKCDPSDAHAPTFGELIRQGKLPGGDVP